MPANRPRQGRLVPVPPPLQVTKPTPSARSIRSAHEEEIHGGGPSAVGAAALADRAVRRLSATPSARRTGQEKGRDQGRQGGQPPDGATTTSASWLTNDQRSEELHWVKILFEDRHGIAGAAGRRSPVPCRTARPESAVSAAGEAGCAAGASAASLYFG